MLRRRVRSIPKVLLAMMAPAFVAATLLPPVEFEPSSMSLAAWQARPYDPELADASWQETYRGFARDDVEHPRKAGGVVFVGSSSIRIWPDLEQVAGTDIVRRGFGGSLLADCARHVDSLVAPSRPRAVVVYAGDNDLAAGASPELVFDRYLTFVKAVHTQLPETRVAFLAIKPSPSRSRLRDQIRATNRLIEEHAQSDPLVDFVDVHSPMLNTIGEPRPELFAADKLHLSAAGYAMWNAALTPHLH